MTEFEIEGHKRGFKLGTYTFKLINKETGTKNIQDVLARLQQTDDQDFRCSFYFCCAKHYALSNKQEIDFEEVDVADWMDEIGADRMLEMTNELFKTYVKNLTAPATGQVAPQ